MGKQISVVKYENSILPGFRNRISRAESIEDVQNFFVYSVRELRAARTQVLMIQARKMTGNMRHF